MWGLGLFLSLENCCLKFQNAYDFENFPSFSLKKICYPGRGGGGGVLKYFHTYVRRLRSFLGGKKKNFNFFWCFQKNKYFLGFEDFVDIFFGSSQNSTRFRGHFFTFKDLSFESRYRIGDIFWGCQNFKYYFGVLEIPDIFRGEG